MRDGWRATTLGGVATLEYGKGLTERDRDGHGWPVYGSAGVVGHHSTPLVDRAPVIIIGRKGTAGSIHWSDTPCWPIDTTYFVKPLASCEPRYLFLALESAGLQDLCAQTGVPGLNRERAYQAELLLPPLDEQRRIVDLIAAVDGAIEAADSLRDTCTRTLRSLGESAWLSESFRTLNDLGVGVTGGTPSTTNAGYWNPPSVPFITPGDIGVDLFISSAARRISTDGAAVSRVFPPHSVLQVCIGATIGKVGILARPATCNQQINVLLGLEDHDALFLALTLAAPSGMRYVLDSAGKTALPLLSKSRWLELKVPWPDAGLRQRTAQVASSLEEIRQNAASVATRLRTVRSALLADLLSGDHEIPTSYDEVMA